MRIVYRVAAKSSSRLLASAPAINHVWILEGVGGVTWRGTKSLYFTNGGGG